MTTLTPLLRDLRIRAGRSTRQVGQRNSRRVPMEPSVETDVLAQPATAVLLQVDGRVVEVRVGSRTIGYIETAGPVFVSLAGERYDVAVEVAQSMTVQKAAIALLGKER